MMSKPINALFGVLTLVAILAIAPSAFAQESGTTVNISAGAGSSPNCSQTKNCFDQDVITVAPGTTVTWQNNDKVSHTVTSGNPSDNQTGTIFDSSLIASGKDFSFTFNNPGTYNYFCQVHPWMTGQVIVAAGASSSSGSTAPSMNMSSGSSMSGMSSSGSSMSGMSNNSSSMNTPSGSSFASRQQQGANQLAQQAGQGQQGGIPLGSSYNAPANMSSTPSSTPSSTQSAPVQPSEASPTSQVGYDDSDNPSGPLQSVGWGVGMVVAGVLSGIGIWTTARRR